MANINTLIILNFLFSVILFLLLSLVYLKITNKSLRRLMARLFRHRDQMTSLAEFEAFIFQLSYSLKEMSKTKTGALLVIEKKNNLQKFVLMGYEVKTRLTSEFLMSIFSNKRSALHDGGVIIRNLDIVSVSSYFPVTQGKMTVALGARHRAAAGLTEQYDAVALIVSETTGKISYSEKGKLNELVSDDLSSLSMKLSEMLRFYMD